MGLSVSSENEDLMKMILEENYNDEDNETNENPKKDFLSQFTIDLTEKAAMAKWIH